MELTNAQMSFISISLNSRTGGSENAGAAQRIVARCNVRTQESTLRALPSVHAFVAQPTDVDTKHGVVLLSDVHGYADASTRSVAEMFASSGFSTVVPDLFNGNPWQPQWDKATQYETWRASIDLSLTRRAITAAITQFETYSLLGFCFGGGRVMETLCDDDILMPTSAIAFYPTST